MKQIKFSLINDDYEVQAQTDVGMDEAQCRVMASFFNQITKQLATGQEAHFEIDGLRKEPVVFTIKTDHLIALGL